MGEKLLLGNEQFDRRRQDRKPWQPLRRAEDSKPCSGSGYVSAREEEAWARLDAEIARLQAERGAE